VPGNDGKWRRRESNPRRQPAARSRQAGLDSGDDEPHEPAPEGGHNLELIHPDQLTVFDELGEDVRGLS
jgi:hypothetical protein